MTTRVQKDWTESEIATLKRWAAIGRSSRQIGDVLGRTRNSVIGFANRNGIKLNPNLDPFEENRRKAKKMRRLAAQDNERCVA